MSRRGRALGLFGLLAVVAALALAPARYPWMLDLTYSLPPGFYEIRPLDRPVATGDLVIACPSGTAIDVALQRGFIGRGNCPSGAAPLLKLVAARSGDVVEHTAGFVSVNGACLIPGETFARDIGGRPLPHAPFGTRRLGRDELWLWAPHPRSLDSRYYGPVTGAQLRGFARPALVMRANLIALGHGPCPGKGE